MVSSSNVTQLHQARQPEHQPATKHRLRLQSEVAVLGGFIRLGAVHELVVVVAVHPLLALLALRRRLDHVVVLSVKVWRRRPRPARLLRPASLRATTAGLGGRAGGGRRTVGAVGHRLLLLLLLLLLAGAPVVCRRPAPSASRLCQLLPLGRRLLLLLLVLLVEARHAASVGARRTVSI